MSRPPNNPHRLRGGWRKGLFALLLLTVFFLTQIDNHFTAPTPTPIILDRHGAFLTQAGHWEGNRVEYGYWITPPPPRVVQATIVLEDRRFWSHPGVDPLAIMRAAWQHVTGRGRSGASTIAMQVARMQRPRPRTLWAKALEAGTALALTARYGHEAVLAQYLRLAPYGEGSHGIGHAARWYFDRPAADLDWTQAALLAAVPQAPALLALRHPVAPAAARAARALNALPLTADERAHAIAALASPGLVPAPRRPDPLLALRYQQPPPGAEPLLHATIDLGVQRWAARLAEKHLDAMRRDGAQQAAVMIVRRGSRDVLAAVGSAGTGPGHATDFTAALRSPGSTLKPFLYAQGLELGLIAPSTVMADLPDGAAGIGNADHAYLGALLPRQALANSRNIPATNLLRRIGLQRGFDQLRALGLHHSSSPPERYGLAMAIGALPTSLDRLMTAYLTLAEDGVAQDLAWTQGPARATHRVIAAGPARLVGRFLSDPMARLPSFPRYGASEFPFTTALKTGTSQGYRDAWTVAWTRDYAVGVWVGRPDNGPMAQLSGARGAGRLAQALLLGLHGGGRADLLAGDLPAPSGWNQAELCTGNGCLTEWVQPRPTPAPAPRLDIVQPEPDTHVWQNPEAPPSLNRLVLRAVAEPLVPQIVWLVDGEPVATAPPATPLTWALRPGRHRFQIRLPLQESTSRAITVVVE